MSNSLYEVPQAWKEKACNCKCYVIFYREMERLEQERKIQELEELRRKVKAIIIDRWSNYWIWSCFIQVFTICKTDINCCFDQAEEEARRRKEEEEERLRQEEEQRQAVLVKAREIEEARRLEEEARRKAEEEARRKVPWYCFSYSECSPRGGGGHVSRIVLIDLLPVSPLANNIRGSGRGTYAGQWLGLLCEH